MGNTQDFFSISLLKGDGNGGFALFVDPQAPSSLSGLGSVTAIAAADVDGDSKAAPSATSLLVLQQVGGAIARVPRNATPYVNRDALYDCFPISIWDDTIADKRTSGGRANFGAR